MGLSSVSSMRAFTLSGVVSPSTGSNPNGCPSAWGARRRGLWRASVITRLIRQKEGVAAVAASVLAPVYHREVMATGHMLGKCNVERSGGEVWPSLCQVQFGNAMISCKQFVVC